MKCKVPVYYTVVLLRQRQLVNVIQVIKVIKVINVVNVVKELVDIVNTIECCRRRRAPEMTVTRRGTAQPRFSNNHQHHRYKTFLLTPIIGLLLQTQNVTGSNYLLFIIFFFSISFIHTYIIIIKSSKKNNIIILSIILLIILS